IASDTAAATCPSSGSTPAELTVESSRVRRDQQSWPTARGLDRHVEQTPPQQVSIRERIPACEGSGFLIRLDDRTFGGRIRGLEPHHARIPPDRGRRRDEAEGDDEFAGVDAAV